MATDAIVETSDLVGARVASALKPATMSAPTAASRLAPARRVSRFVSPIRQLEGKARERRAHDDTHP